MNDINLEMQSAQHQAGLIESKPHLGASLLNFLKKKKTKRLEKNANFLQELLR